MLVKFCGLKRIEDIQMCNKLFPDMIGLIFAESPRKVDVELAEKILKVKGNFIKAVGVFKNQSVFDVLKIAKRLGLDFVQLHGEEDLEYVKFLRQEGVSVIKAVEISSEEDLRKAEKYVNLVNFVLLDRPKGSDLDITQIAKLAKFPYIIAGGITLENLDKFLALSPVGIDISSGIETNGLKDYKKMKGIIERVKPLRNGGLG
ncbi:phosphoribosylanthranilate isomerase [Pseudothermotoga thermarum]|uniref:N-(5'-phosphoribosyl)anthranilate isomerase n=1 Tax=Pseudothermotoga thermarum DSM 5069 TaxID=688269 RepID=F7YWY4_9THEM|nr:phosphoribosylanthranilate isomerase [Pseudothermotoga thermarum]AEH50576.1 phosphoribosylanthranilate isomerase [Pseudothermotoga thermarum DSM 5069]